RISRREILRRATALYIRTGTLSSPKLIEPDQSALAMAEIVPTAWLDAKSDQGAAGDLAWQHQPEAVGNGAAACSPKAAAIPLIALPSAKLRGTKSHSSKL